MAEENRLPLPSSRADEAAAPQTETGSQGESGDDDIDSNNYCNASSRIKDEDNAPVVAEGSCPPAEDSNDDKVASVEDAVSYTHLTLPTKA